MEKTFELMHAGKGYSWESINMMTIYERDMHVQMLVNWLQEKIMMKNKK